MEKIFARMYVCKYCLLYTSRYSSDNQRSESIDAQIRLIRKWAQEYNIIIDKVYADEAQSAKRDDRQQFQQMIADSKKQKGWQLVLVHKLDRFARNRMDSVASVSYTHLLIVILINVAFLKCQYLNRLIYMHLM